MTTTTTRRRRALVALALALALTTGAACGSGGGGAEAAEGDDGVASLDGSGGTSDDDSGDDDSDGGGGDGGGDGPAQGERPSSAEFQDAALAYAECMREHGIDMPDPEFSGEGGVSIRGGPDDGSGAGPGDEEFDAAEEACSPIMEDALPDLQLSPEEQAERQDQMVAVAECMRDKGHDMPDPEVGDDGSVRIRSRGPAGGGEEVGPPDDEFQADMEDCSRDAGAPVPGEGPGAGGSTDDSEDG
jgi:hypothetical protein